MWFASKYLFRMLPFVAVAVLGKRTLPALPVGRFHANYTSAWGDVTSVEAGRLKGTVHTLLTRKRNFGKA